MNAPRSSPVAKLKLPPQLGGGDPTFIFSHMGLRAERGGGPDEWTIRENFIRPRNSTEKLVWSEYLAGPGLKLDRFDRLAAPPQDEYMSLVSKRRIDAEFEKIAGGGGSGSLTPMLYTCQVEVLTASDSDLGAVVREWHNTFRGFKFSDNANENIFPDVSVHWISISDVLYWRMWLPSMLMRLELDPGFASRLQAGTLARGRQLNFASNHELVAPAILHGNFLGPLLACFAPRTWSVHVPRLMNSIIFSLGRDVPGQSATPMDTLDLLPRRFSNATAYNTALVDPARDSWRESIDWWAMRLNQLFELLSDPTIYTNNTGDYEPYRHQNWMINAAELFDRVTSALRSVRDKNAALILTFSALDLVGERFIGSDSSALSNPNSAQLALDKVQASMPASVAEVLIPGAQRAVQSLHDIATGFFMGAGQVEYASKRGAVVKSVSEAVGPLMRARRNAVHGFGGGQAAAKGVHELLAQHKGDLPDDVVYLPYLYLLKVLCDLPTLRKRIEGGAG